MTGTKTIVIVLAAGLGTRMGSALPKVLHPLAGRPMLLHLFETIECLSPDRTVVVIGPDMDTVGDIIDGHKLKPAVTIQKERLGTGHALMAAKDYFEGAVGTILVLYGDTPLLTTNTLQALMAKRQGDDDPAVVVLGFQSSQEGDYGRLILNNNRKLLKIVEAKDATPEQLATPLCNSGVLAIDAAALPSLLKQLENNNAKGEYYLTDIIQIALKQGRGCAVVESVENELIGINSKADLAQAEAIMQGRLRLAAMNEGATLLDPSTVYFTYDTKLGDNVTIGPNVYCGPGVKLGDNVEIRAFCHLEGTNVASGATIGPFARLRPGADIGSDAHIGNFVEVKNSIISAGVKANHLSYIGDARVGQRVNIGAGTITCNYDGYTKSVTEIGDDAFIGSNTALVAPVFVGDGAVTGAGSVITKDVEKNALAVTRTDQKVVLGWASKRHKIKGD